ncbi:hypothetical protein J5N97_026750 [Dioscorea zingiberensis]|uniref:Uncharacterized protein n=1 Tax=Dioscorea zingiberensis TaxID=325984 RepID=A0A9D5H742_9LILI|nr:hypothetical protein J5N97_026750 [Dioscorea zingiberensis]
MAAEIVIEGHPVLPPLRISSAVSDNEECVTPKTEEHILKPALVCPPPPTKPITVKRRRKAAHRSFYSIPRDLTPIFLARPLTLEKKIKKIRVI